MEADYIIVGAGLTGATLARLLFDAGKDVWIVERRAQVGGNVVDHLHPSGIRVHTYGPHYFRTSSDKIWRFVNRFASFYEYKAALLSKVDGSYENWPIVASYIRRTVGDDWTPEFVGEPTNFEEAALSCMPSVIYQKFVKEYNEKQWGVPVHTLSAALCGRFDVRHDDEPLLKPRVRYQGIPECGYTNFMHRLLDGIPVVLNCDFLRHRQDIQHRRKLIFTGPIDAFFNYDLGRLGYRGQQREHTYLQDVDYAQPCGQVNTPQHSDGPQIRILEWKHMMPSDIVRNISGTLITTETPFAPYDEVDFEYPVPDEANSLLFSKYNARARDMKDVLICGRLGEYKYYDMDQAIGRAMMLAHNLLDEPNTTRHQLPPAGGVRAVA